MSLGTGMVVGRCSTVQQSCVTAEVAEGDSMTQGGPTVCSDVGRNRTWTALECSVVCRHKDSLQAKSRKRGGK
jgi:hypothetical protein